MSIAFTASNPWQNNNIFSSFASSASPGAAAFSFSGTTAGTVLVAQFFLATGCSVTGMVDDAGNTWTVVAGSSGAGWQGFNAYAENPSHTGTNRVAITFTGGPSAIGCVNYYGELTGAPASSPASATNSATGSASAPTTSLSTVASASCILATTVNNAAVNPGAGSGYTGGGSNNGTYGYAGEYNLSSGSGTITANFTGSTTWNLVAMAIGTTGAAPGGNTPVGWQGVGAMGVMVAQ